MRAEVEIEVEGKAIRLAMPIGGLEMVAIVNPALEEVRDSLMAAGPMGWRVWRLDELKAVLSAGLRYGAAEGFTAGSLIETLGVTPARDLALRLLNLAFSDDKPGKGEADPTPPNASGRPDLSLK